VLVFEIPALLKCKHYFNASVIEIDSRYFYAIRVAVEATVSTSYSKLRVMFDPSDGRSFVLGNAVANNAAHCQSPMTGTRVPSPSRRSNVPNGSNNNLTNRAHAPVGINGTSTTASSSVYGDISEPFWIQLPQQVISSPATASSSQSTIFNPAPSQYSAPVTPHANSESEKQLACTFQMWCDPDEAFITEIKKHITIADKIVFWEMAKAIMELPRLSEYCDSVIRNSKDLAAILKRTEFKFLWSADAPDLLPKDAASELVSAAYAASY
jgi:hypothetical protein